MTEEFTPMEQRWALWMLLEVARPRSCAPILFEGQVYGGEYSPEFIAELKRIAGIEETNGKDANATG